MGSGASKTKKSEETNASKQKQEDTKTVTEKQTSGGSVTNEDSDQQQTQTDVTKTTDDDDSAPAASTVSTLAAIDEETGAVGDSEISYSEFPTHVNLNLANEKQANQNKKRAKVKAGAKEAYPSWKDKASLFQKKKFEKIDQHCDTVRTRSSDLNSEESSHYLVHVYCICTCNTKPIVFAYVRRPQI